MRLFESGKKSQTLVPHPKKKSLTLGLMLKLSSGSVKKEKMFSGIFLLIKEKFILSQIVANSVNGGRGLRCPEI